MGACFLLAFETVSIEAFNMCSGLIAEKCFTFTLLFTALQEAFRTVDVERSGTIETEHLPGLVGKLLRKDASNNNNNVVWQRRNSQNTLKNGKVWVRESGL